MSKWCCEKHMDVFGPPYFVRFHPNACPYCEIDRLKAELEEEKQLNFALSNLAKPSAIKELERQLDASQALLAEARAEIDKTYKTWCGRDYMHLPLSAAMGSVVAQARQEAASEAIEEMRRAYPKSGCYQVLQAYFRLEG